MNKLRTRNKILDEDINKIVSLYQDGYSSNYIVKLFNISNGTVFNYLKLRNIKSRSVKSFSRNNKKYKFDISFFEKETPQLAYFFGFCLGDGNIGLNRGNSYLRISINKKDRGVLETFVKWINGDSGLIKDRKNVSELRLNHSFFKNDLSKWGIVKNKTYNPCIPIINNDLLKYFLIGLIDADGTVKFNNGKYKINIVGNKLIMKWFINSIKLLGFDNKITIYDKYSNVWDRVHINDKNGVIKLAKILGIHDCNFILDRKWSMLKAFIIKNDK